MLNISRLTAAATLTCLLALPTGASATAGTASASAASTAKIERQLKKLRKQVRTLKHAVANMPSPSAGAQGPQGEAGPPGPAGPAGALSGPAGGDLTGSYPNPQIVDSAIGSLQLAGNAITNDTSELGEALGEYTSKIGTGAIGRKEIADGQIQAAELGTVTTRTATDNLSAHSSATTKALCAPGEQVLSGGSSWGNFHTELRQMASMPTASADGWMVAGYNGGGFSNPLTTYALCLS